MPDIKITNLPLGTEIADDDELLYIDTSDTTAGPDGTDKRVLIGSLRNIANRSMTTVELINSSLDLTVGESITTNGFYEDGDGGGAQWVLTGDTGTASQTPADLGDAKFTDAGGSVWGLTSKNHNALMVGVLADWDDDDEEVGTDQSSAALAYTSWASSIRNQSYFPAGKYLMLDKFTPSGSVDYVHVKGDGKGKTEFIHQRPSNGINTPIIQLIGAEGEKIPLTAQVSSGDYIINISDTTGYTEGDYALLQDVTQRVIDNVTGNGVTWFAEWVRVKTVDSSTQLTVYSGFELSYSTSATLMRINPCTDCTFEDFTIRNPIKGSGGLSARGAYFQNTVRLKIDDVEFVDLDDQGAVFVNCLFMQSKSPSYRGLSNDTSEFGGSGYGYNFSYGNWHCQVFDAYGEKCRHVVTAGAGSGAENAHIYYYDGMAHQCYGAGWDTHPGGGRDFVFYNCSVDGPLDNPISYPPGFQIRSRESTVINPNCTNVGHGVSVVLADDITITGGIYTNVGSAVNIRAARRVTVNGDMVVRGARSNLFVVKNNNSAILDSDMTGISITSKVEMYGDCEGYALDFDLWNDDFIVNRKGLMLNNVTKLSSTNVPHSSLYGGVAISSGANNVKYSSIDRSAVDNSVSLSVLVSGEMYLGGIHIDKGENLTRLGFCGSTGPVNQSNRWLAIYDKEFNLLGVTSDSGSSGTLGVSFQELEVPVLTPYSGIYYVGIVCVADTTQSMRGLTIPSALSGATPVLTARAGSGLTSPSSAPLTLSPSSNPGAYPWFAVV